MTVNGTLYNPDLIVVNGTGGSTTVSSSGSLEIGSFVQAGGSGSGLSALHPGPRRRGRRLLLGHFGMTVQGGPLEAGQSIDVPEDGTLSLANDLTSAGTISMETDGSIAVATSISTATPSPTRAPST